jgi:hypothetical protein
MQRKVESTMHLVTRSRMPQEVIDSSCLWATSKGLGVSTDTKCNIQWARDQFHVTSLSSIYHPHMLHQHAPNAIARTCSVCDLAIIHGKSNSNGSASSPVASWHCSEATCGFALCTTCGSISYRDPLYQLSNALHSHINMVMSSCHADHMLFRVYPFGDTSSRGIVTRNASDFEQRACTGCRLNNPADLHYCVQEWVCRTCTNVG